MGFLSCDDVNPLLTQPIPDFGMTYGPLEAWKHIFAATNGQPFLTQAVAYELVQLLNEQNRQTATPADIEAAISLALVTAGTYFANVWNDAGEGGREILRAIVAGEPLTGASEGQKRAWLVDHDVLDEAGSFKVPMMERWLGQFLKSESRR